MCQLKHAGLSTLARTCERALLIAKELAFQQVSRQRRTVQGNKRALAPRRGVVDCLRQNLFTGTALSGDQDRRIRCRLLFCQIFQLQHLYILCDNVGKCIFGNVPLVEHLTP